MDDERYSCPVCDQNLEPPFAPGDTCGVCAPPKVLNKHTDKLHPGAVYIGRGSPWGNPFKIGEHGTRDQVCDRFECEVLPTLDVRALRGKDLVCFCAPRRCHGDALLRKANS